MVHAGVFLMFYPLGVGIGWRSIKKLEFGVVES